MAPIRFESPPSPKNTLFNGKRTVGLGIFSCGDLCALGATLESHKDTGFLDMFDKKFMFSPNMTGREGAVATNFGVRVPRSLRNNGDAEGLEMIVNWLATDYVLLLKYDTRTAANDAMLRKNLIDADYYMRVSGDSLHCYLTDDLIFDDLSSGEIPYDKKGIEGHWMLYSDKIPWSSNGAFFPREWFMGILRAVKEMREDEQIWVDGHLDLDATLAKSSWWAEQNFRVGIINEKLFALPPARATTIPNT